MTVDPEHDAGLRRPADRTPGASGRHSSMPLDPEAIYDQRFNKSDSAHKDDVWIEICRYLERFIPPDARLLDIACGDGHFIRHVRGKELWATDLRDMTRHLPANIHFVQASGLELDTLLAPKHFDVIFMSNYLEHLLSRSEVVKQLRICHHLLRPGGTVVVLQPNIRLVGGSYWDFIDHHVALTERSLQEAAALAGFTTEAMIRRFLPYSTLGRLPQHHLLVRAYLRLPWAWLLFGKQTLYIGRA